MEIFTNKESILGVSEVTRHLWKNMYISFVNFAFYSYILCLKWPEFLKKNPVDLLRNIYVKELG